jgi:serine/threonine-protein kinase
MGSCPPDHVLAAFVAGELGSADADALEKHVDGCKDCFRTLATYAAAFGQEAPSSHDTQEVRVARMQRARPLAPGATVGRYVVREWIGEGGAGTVYAGFDPELDRPVALKLLHHAEGSEIQREARAMAKLAHPNVVSVFDAGAFDDRVFIAMELVVGPNLRGWLAERPRDVGEIVDAFVGAGRGLAAAHAVGLVHRDFKPENVLMGADGRARVTDFGLARAASASLASVTNPYAGTPAYMAPEQRLGEADARSDQYSYCLSFTEALGAGAPASLRKVLSRGVREAPAERFPSMESLLAELEGARRARPRWRGLAWAGAAVILAAASIAYARTRAAPAPPVAPPVVALPEPAPAEPPAPPAPSAPPVVSAPPREARHPLPSARPKPHADCDPPYDVDELGRKHFKRECL